MSKRAIPAVVVAAVASVRLYMGNLKNAPVLFLRAAAVPAIGSPFVHEGLPYLIAGLRRLLTEADFGEIGAARQMLGGGIASASLR